MGGTRKLAAILVSDVVGYSRLTGADEDRILARLRALPSDLIDPTIAVHHGRVVKRTGDGILIEFPSVVDGVRCAIEMQTGLIERNAGLPAERRIEFRVGIHLGDVVEEADGDLMGAGVNIAARLESICEPGAICLSEDAYRQVKGRLDLAVCDLGPETDQSLVLNPGMPVATSGEWSKSDHLSLPWTGILADAQDESGQHNAAIRTVRRWVVLPIVDLAWRFHDVMCLTLWRIPKVRSV